MGAVSETAVGATTVTWTTAEVPEIPPAVATALMAYVPAPRALAVKLKGAVWTDPHKVLLAKKETLVTVVPPLIVALAETVTSAGATKTAPLVGLTIVTVGAVATAGVERV